MATFAYRRLCLRGVPNIATSDLLWPSTFSPSLIALLFEEAFGQALRCRWLGTGSDDDTPLDSLSKKAPLFL